MQLVVGPFAFSAPTTCHPSFVFFPTGWKGKPCRTSLSARRWRYWTPRIRSMCPWRWENSLSLRCSNNFSQVRSRVRTLMIVWSFCVLRLGTTRIRSGWKSRLSFSDCHTAWFFFADSSYIVLSFLPWRARALANVLRITVVPASLSTTTLPFLVFPFADINRTLTTGRILFLLRAEVAEVRRVVGGFADDLLWARWWRKWVHPFVPPLSFDLHSPVTRPLFRQEPLMVVSCMQESASIGPLENVGQLTIRWFSKHI